MTQEEKQSQCLYGRTYKERLRSCGYCSVACPARIPDFDTEVYNWLKQHGSDETRQLIEMTARHFWEMGRRDERMEMMAEQCQYRGTMILTPTETRGWEAIDWCYYKEKQIKEKCSSNCPYKAKEE